jgi:hypothetical protein
MVIYPPTANSEKEREFAGIDQRLGRAARLTVQ